jgi:large subunit ribosomal protein L29
MARVIAEFRELPDDELFARLEGNKEELFNLRFQLATGQLDNPMRVRQVRHDVARILTVLRERHLEQELEEEIGRADEEALARSRAAQASGEKKGESLASLQEAAMSRAEEAEGSEESETPDEPEAAEEPEGPEGDGAAEEEK